MGSIKPYYDPHIFTYEGELLKTGAECSSSFHSELSKGKKSLTGHSATSITSQTSPFSGEFLNR